VAVLCDQNAIADAVLAEIMAEYHTKTGHKPEAFLGTSPGAWAAGTQVINL